MNDNKFIELVTKELTGEISAEEQQELEALLGSGRYAKRYQIYKMYWAESDLENVDNTELFQKVKSRILSGEVSEVGESSGKTYHFIRWRGAAAAILFALCSVLLYIQLKRNDSDNAKQWQTFTTARGNKMSIVLPDGSHVKLNAASQLKFPVKFTGKERKIYLSGEAFFDVKKDELRPFIIQAGKMKIRVLGTAFNVKAYPNEKRNETTLITGSVEVVLKDGASRRIVLKPSEKLIVDYSKDARRIAEPHKNQPERIVHPQSDVRISSMQKADSVVIETSWTHNKLIFKDMEFGDVAREMERWYNKDISIEGEDLKRLKFSGNFEKESIEEALRALRMTEPFNYKIAGKHVYIY